MLAALLSLSHRPAASLRITTTQSRRSTRNTQTRRLSTRNAMETLEDSVLYHIPKTSSAPVVQLIHELQLQEDDINIETLSFDHVRNDVKYGALNPKRSVPALKLVGGASYTGSLITESGAIISLPRVASYRRMRRRGPSSGGVGSGSRYFTLERLCSLSWSRLTSKRSRSRTQLTWKKRKNNSPRRSRRC